MSELIRLTFDEHDKLGLRPFGQKLERFLMVEHDFVEGGLVVALNAPFGAGKTTFLSMWKSDLDKRKEADPSIPKAIILNAWESDYCGDPLLSVVNALIKTVGADESAKEAAGRLREAAKDVGWFVVGLANDLVSHWSGLDPVSAGELAEDKKKARQPRVPDFVSLYEERTKALQKLRDALRGVFGGDSPKAFLFVDELDRCRPDYAINYLETIKHVFDVHGLVFVLAVDYDQLECSAKALFGGNLKFSDYFRKFAQRMVALPEPTKSNLQNLANHYVKYYLEREGKRISMMGHQEHRAENVIQFISALRMPPRQIQEVFRIIGHTVSGDLERRGRLFWCIGVGVIMMSALKVAGHGMYRRIGNIEATHPEVGELLIKLLGKKDADWWFRVYVTGSSRNECPDEASVVKLFKDLGFIENDSSFDRRRELGDFGQGWGHSWADRDRWQQIYQTIETANTFS
ncbi:MAG: hypothetical protein EXS35_13040 [Pedosphaera sp.]|nr:hypothetical protein [Pedosphaera sp.]